MKRRTVLTGVGITVIPVSGCTGFGAENDTMSSPVDEDETVEDTPRTSATETPMQTLSPGDGTLRITDDTLYVEGTTASIRGRIRNAADHDVDHVTIYADLFDEEGERLSRVRQSLRNLPSGEEKRFWVTYESEADAERVADYELAAFGSVEN